MSSQTDLDQGGTSRQWVPKYLGPSVGWVRAPAQNILLIAAAGTFSLDPSTSLVQVNVAGLVTIKLPKCVVPTAGAQAQPSLFVQNPITIVDTGGHASSFNITIQPNNVGETIMGLTSILLSVNYGGYVLQPNSAQATWNSISP
jgi:hypothetical protein